MKLVLKSCNLTSYYFICSPSSFRSPISLILFILLSRLLVLDSLDLLDIREHFIYVNRNLLPPLIT